jgi:type II secretory pathway component GspD/PulD (secretin)
MRKSAARALGALALAGAALASTQDGRRSADASKPAKPEGAAPELTSAPQDPASQENSPAASRGASNSQSRSQANWVLSEPEIELRTLLELCTSGLGVHLEYDKAKLDGRVSLDRTGEYSPLELWQVFNREMAARSLATVQPPGHSGFKVVPVADAAGTARVESADLRDARAGYLKVVVGLDNRAPEELVETLKQMLSKAGGQISAVREARALVISDYEPHLRQALSVIGLLDLPAAQPVTMEFPLEHASPTAVATLLERLVNTRKAVGAPLKGAALALSDSRDILVIAPASEAAWWRDAIAQLDRPESVVTLHYTPRRFGVAETARLIEATVRPEGAAAAGAGAAWKLVEDRLTGTLVITTTPARHEQVQEVLTRLDETPEGPGKPLRAFSIRNRRVSEVLGGARVPARRGRPGAARDRWRGLQGHWGEHGRERGRAGCNRDRSPRARSPWARCARETP